jgi:hypothetical protein
MRFIAMSFTTCPCKEGTERAIADATTSQSTAVSPHVPAKRELKDWRGNPVWKQFLRFTTCPCKEGTESPRAIATA